MPQNQTLLKEWKKNIESILIKLIELQNQCEILKRSYKYNNGWEYPELEDNLKKQLQLDEEIMKEFDNELISDSDKDIVWNDLNIIEVSRRVLTEDYFWMKQKEKHEEGKERAIERNKRKTQSNSLFRFEESDEDRIMRRLREGNGDLEGF